MGFFFRKVMLVGRVTTFCIGLAVVIAVALGVATTALAAVPGDPFKLGGINYVNRATTLAGAGAILRVDNDGTVTALGLKVGDPTTLPENKATAPMKVDSQAKVANLNADELDGLGSREFMREPGYTPWVKSVADSSRHKIVTAPCPTGHIAIGGSARITATRVPEVDGVPGTGSEVPVALTVSGGAGTSGWRAEAQEMAPFEGDWYLLVDPLCVPSQAEIAILEGQ
ncbi:MAG TPA: hypothetical protein VFI90_19030 [Rubrobacter sp.]|nr:hypothetical protein [Rubrobacter sp.]